MLKERGGNAVAAWVACVDESAVRKTKDVDILLRRTDLEKARTALESAGFVYRRVAMLGQPEGLHLFLELVDASWLERLEPDLRKRLQIILDTPEG